MRLERDGLDLAHLEKVLTSLKRSGKLPRVKLLYLVSYFQNPTGVTTRFEKKAAVLKLLKKILFTKLTHLFQQVEPLKLQKGDVDNSPKYRNYQLFQLLGKRRPLCPPKTRTNPYRMRILA